MSDTITTYRPVPDFSNDPTEKSIRNFLIERCEWREGQESDKYAVYSAYKQWSWSRGLSPLHFAYVEKMLLQLGYSIGRQYILGIFVSAQDATVPVVPAPKTDYAASERLPGGSAAVSAPHEFPILPDDDPILRKQKEDYNAALRPPEKKEEEIFTSAKPAM